ncbi:hypothetical protein D3C77_265790 [compost metagenome]
MLLRWLRIGEAGHDDPVAADGRGDMVNAVQLHARVGIDEDDVAVPPHQFDNDPLGRNVSELVALPDIDRDDPLHPVLGNRFDDAALAVLAQQHAEHRGLLRVRKGFLRKVNARVSRIG